MKKHPIVIGMTLILLVVGLTGCTDNNVSADRAKFIGTWYIIGYDKVSIAYTWIFNENGSFIEIDSNGYYTYSTWNIKEGEIYIGSIPSKYAFSNNDKTITIYDGSPVILQKEET